MNSTIDLKRLSRGGQGAGAAPAVIATARPVGVPEPASKWKTRLLLPGAILLAVGGMLAYTAREALWPATPVRVVPVMVRTATTDGPAGSTAPSLTTQPSANPSIANASSGAV